MHKNVTENRPKIFRRILNAALLISFLITILVPLTGIIIHKLASTVFLLLCLIHTLLCRKGMTAKRIGLLTVVVLAFTSGVLGLIFDEIPLVMALHKCISIGSVFFLAIHIFVFRKRIH